MSTSDVKVIGDYDAAVTIDGSTHYLLIQPGSSSTAYKKITRNILLGVTGQPVDTSTAQTLTNKILGNTTTMTLKDSMFTLQDDGDTTKQAQFQLSGLTTATTRTYTLPDANTTLVGIGTTQTLTNKTLTSPTISGGTIDNSTVTVDSIGGHTSANIVTVAGLQINNGVLNTNNSVVTANIADAAVTPAKLLAGTGSGWTWQSWTPTWANLTIGNATTTYKYIQTGKTVFYQLVITLGNTSSISGSPTFSLPVTPSSNYIANDPNGSYIGDAAYLNASTASYVGRTKLVTSTTLQLQVGNSSSTYTGDTAVSATVPFSFTNGSRIFCWGFYEAA